MKTVMSKKFEAIDWLKYINSIETMPSMKDACIRYEKDLVSIISENRQFKKPPVLMLSGGVDSMMLGTVLKKHFGLQQSFSFASVLDTYDVQQSQKSAKSLGVNNELIIISFDEIIENLHLIQGKKIRGSWGGASDPDRDIKLLDQLYAKGELPLEQLIGKRYQLADINLALDDIRHRKTTRASITID